MTATAKRARFTIALEQRGSWGKKALTQSPLDPELGAVLQNATKAAGGQIVLIRGIDGHAEDATAPRVVYLSGGDPAHPWLLRGVVTDPRALLDLPWETFADGPAPTIDGFAPADPVILVCTNGKRDQCCSVEGRPLAKSLLVARPHQVWEVSHIGGHRFAPTALLLPTGQVLGRVTLDVALAALDAAARDEALIAPEHDRGRAQFPPLLQAAESFLREEFHVAALAGLSLEETSPTTVRAVVDGRTLALTLAAKPLPAAKASCGIEPQVRHTWGVVSCEQVQ